MQTTTINQWQIALDADNTAAYALFAADRIWNGYSICDLEPPLRQYTRVALAVQVETGRSAACTLLQHPEFSALVVHGEPHGVAALLEAQVALPSSTFILARQSHVAAIETRYDFAAPRQAMLRMVVDRGTFQPLASDLSAVERLSLADLPALESLYATYSAHAFTADQLRSGVFYGVHVGDRIVAAGGTHALAPRYGIAAVGNIYTHPQARGRGYAGAISTAVVAALLEGPYQEVILNVAEANQAARRLYGRLGFREHCGYWEGQARIRKDPQ